MNTYYYYYPSCSFFTYNKPKLFQRMAYLPAELLWKQIEFKPTVELLLGKRPNWMQRDPSMIESFSDNGNLEKLQDLLGNLDQRE